LVFLWLFISAGTVLAQEKKGLSPLDVAKLKQVDYVLISPNGSRIVYTLEVPVDPRKVNEPEARYLYLFDLLSTESVPFVTSMSVSSVQFRPGNNSITFLADGDNSGISSLYEISLSGGEARQIYTFPTSILDYSWSPDGQYLAFIAPQPPDNTGSTLPYQPEIYEENVSHRRGYIANMKRTEYQPDRILVQGSVYQVKWSPDGSRMAVAVAPTPLVDDYYMRQKVLILDGEGKLTLGEVNHRGKLGQIEWSPDGNFLAMIAGADIHDPAAGRLFVVSADGGKPNNLMPDFEGAFEQFQWVNNQMLHYLASEGVWATYGKINRDGTEMQTIVAAGGPNLTAFSRSRTGTSVFVADSPRHPGELYLMKKDDLQPHRITNSNPWLNNRAFGRQEVVAWQARDSVRLQGLLLYPLDYIKGKTYPLITVVHGGPESHFDNGWLTSYSQPGQVGAARGYFVFYPNYRGSTGRGVAFAKSSQNDPAGAEFNDIVDGVDELVKVGIADKDKVGVTGASYGGYATAWLSTRYTDRFAAGVMLAGVSNNISKWATSDIPRELYLVHLRRHIWEDYAFFLKRSPIYYAGQAKTPLLIATGTEDARVHPAQSLELYRHIKTRTDTPVRLVLYPGEGHGNARSTARLDYNVRMLRWFERYLKGETMRPDSEVEADVVQIGN
jgi:dipeptidyl aminopeptidase/acylaminoacyl peptidase